MISLGKTMIDQSSMAILFAVAGGVLLLSMYSVAALSVVEHAKDKIRMKGKKALKGVFRKALHILPEDRSGG